MHLQLIIILYKLNIDILYIYIFVLLHKLHKIKTCDLKALDSTTVYRSLVIRRNQLISGHVPNTLSNKFHEYKTDWNVVKMNSGKLESEILHFLFNPIANSPNSCCSLKIT